MFFFASLKIQTFSFTYLDTLFGTLSSVTSIISSFSCPIMAGAVTCLMQACPSATPLDIINTIHTVGDNATHPDEVFGYGVPDIYKAYEILKH